MLSRRIQMRVINMLWQCDNYVPPVYNRSCRAAVLTCVPQRYMVERQCRCGTFLLWLGGTMRNCGGYWESSFPAPHDNPCTETEQSW